MVSGKRFFIVVVMVALALLMGACGDAATATIAAATTAPVPAATTTPVATTAAVAATTAPAPGVTTAPVGGSTTVPVSGTATAAPAVPTTAASAAAIDCKGQTAAAGKNVKIGIMVQASIPALAQAIDGVKKGLAACGYVDGKNLMILEKNANGDIAALTTIGQYFRDEKVDAIFTVGTAALTAAYNTNKDGSVPIIFNSVTDPYAAVPGLIKSATDHGFITGVQANPPVEQGIDLIKQLVPGVKSIGLVWNKGEKNSQVVTERVRAYTKTLGIELVEASAAASTDVQAAAQSIVDKVDVFFSTTDVTVNAALEAYVKVAVDNKKPLIGNDPASAKRGAAVALGLDYPDNGVNSAVMTIPILNGTAKPTDVPIQKQEKVFIGINAKTADQMGLKLPADLVKKADATYSS